MGGAAIGVALFVCLRSRRGRTCHGSGMSELNTLDEARSHEVAPAAEPAPSRETVWHAVQEALRGSRRNYTEGPIGRAILVLAIPMVLEMAMESIFVICDVFFVA